MSLIKKANKIIILLTELNEAIRALCVLMAASQNKTITWDCDGSNDDDNDDSNKKKSFG